MFKHTSEFWSIFSKRLRKLNFHFCCLRIGALAKYRCERGYKIVGEPLVTCEENGLWSGAVPECICELTIRRIEGKK